LLDFLDGRESEQDLFQSIVEERAVPDLSYGAGDFLGALPSEIRHRISSVTTEARGPRRRSPGHNPKSAGVLLRQELLIDQHLDELGGFSEPRLQEIQDTGILQSGQSPQARQKAGLFATFTMAGLMLPEDLLDLRLAERFMREESDAALGLDLREQLGQVVADLLDYRRLEAGRLAWTGRAHGPSPSKAEGMNRSMTKREISRGGISFRMKLCAPGAKVSWMIWCDVREVGMMTGTSWSRARISRRVSVPDIAGMLMSSSPKPGRSAAVTARAASAFGASMRAGGAGLADEQAEEAAKRDLASSTIRIGSGRFMFKRGRAGRR
jgi:hypothetical protein